MKKYQPTQLGRAVVRFFQEYLPTLRDMSRHTIQCYRDSMILFLGFAAKDCRRPIESLELADITADRIGRFLAFLEAERGNSITTRNIRLAAMHTIARYLVSDHPEQLGRLATSPRDSIHTRRASDPNRISGEDGDRGAAGKH